MEIPAHEVLRRLGDLAGVGAVAPGAPLVVDDLEALLAHHAGHALLAGADPLAAQARPDGAVPPAPRALAEDAHHAVAYVGVAVARRGDAGPPVLIGALRYITLDPGGPERDLGLERSRIMWPFATYKQRGIRQAFGTDSPITAVTSMNVLYTAITRQDPKSHWPEGGWLPSERIDAATALRNYTLGSAYAAGDEQNLGSLEPGKYADLVVLDQNPLIVDPQDLQATKVQATYLAGNLIYER
ncbi:MAG TPA: amidohydrolase family protein [Coriobacteriaceae bacterium]|nr:amidohydrolase family protein [Coriobacteriaceae bacterium]